ncbi:MAG: DUF2975 domain-containing protein [Oscillospiraceae bacterium]|nr:DUF2975 domain-containing protein [Oscillospiraceae bacterium]
MSQKAIAGWLKGLILGISVCGLIVYALVVPTFGSLIAGKTPGFAPFYLQWLIFISLTALPIIPAMVFAWKISAGIGRDRAFTVENAKYFKYIAVLALIDSMYFFIGNVVLLLCGMNHPGIAILSLIVVFAGIAIAIAAAALSYMFKKAAALQDQSDWTI